ncbi:BrnA antitoxin family protein [Geminicoccus roseus]|uniref:BrnA antitoxin family protein n=1 Tax=Geminicoccus roseus TaxID=404900 RepID=UPI00041C4400|nr:BrnA antitoxin family protein [Geminicoccus roseus]
MDKKKPPAERRQIPKQAISLRVDVDVLEWFKSGGPGYQTRMLKVLRAHVQSERARSSPQSPA